MRKLSAPTHDTATVFQRCVNSIGSEDLRTRLSCIKTDITSFGLDYKHKGESSKLFELTKFEGTNNDCVLGEVTKKELKDLYDYQMVPPTKPGRKVYDELKNKATFNICPYCGFGHVTTLDHYLPKAKFPTFSVLPLNLVPSCSDCNKRKTTIVAKDSGSQSIHPYFDHILCQSDQWLFAALDHTTPVTIRYFTDPPSHWSSSDKKRVESHFSEFNLASRFSIQATSELATQRELLKYYFRDDGPAGVKQALELCATVKANIHLNSWDTALFQALSSDERYYCGGFMSD